VEKRESVDNNDNQRKGKEVGITGTRNGGLTKGRFLEKDRRRQKGKGKKREESERREGTLY